MSDERAPEPPEPPEVPRRVRLYGFQWVGLGLLAVLPALAAAGVFGETWREERVAGAGLEVTVRYPDRFRYKQLNSVTVQIGNASGRGIDTLTVSLDTALANRFSTVRAIPSFARAYEAELTDVGPGETRLLLIELQAEEYGRHEGVLAIGPGGALRIPLSIRVFP